MTESDLQHMLSKIFTMKVESRGEIRDKILELELEVKREINRVRKLNGLPRAF